MSKESFFNPPILRRRFAIPDGILLCKSEPGISRGYTSVFAGHSERRFMRAFSAANLRAGLTGLRRQYNFCKERDTVVDGYILLGYLALYSRSRNGSLLILGCSCSHPKLALTAEKKAKSESITSDTAQ